MKGIVIAFEGGEGSGKDTMIGRLKTLYADRQDIVYTREPGGTRVGEQLRAVLMDPHNKDMDARVELMLFLAARMQLVSEVIDPALAQGKSVITNRFGLSTEAYQIYGRKRLDHRVFLQGMDSRFVRIDPYYVLLDVMPEVGLKRVEKRGDGKTRFDAEDLEFHHRVRDGYLRAVHPHMGHVVIDANRPLEDVWGKVRAHVEQLLA